MTTELDTKSNFLISIDDIFTADTWLNIFLHLTYHDLLNLKKTNKHVHKLLSDPEITDLWIAARFHQHWSDLLKIIYSNVHDKDRDAFKKYIQTALTFFISDKKNYCSKKFGVRVDKNTYFEELSKTPIFNNFEVCKTLHYYIDRIDKADKRLKIISKNKLNDIKYDLGPHIFYLLPLICLPLVAQIAACIELYQYQPHLYYSTARLWVYSRQMLLFCAIFPPAYVFLPFMMLYAYLKKSLLTYLEKKYTGKLEAEFDEFKGNIENIMAYHSNRPFDDKSLENNQFDPKVIQQRDALLSLFLSDKFKDTNSSAIQNIQKAIAKYPDMSCERFFSLIQTEINRSTSIEKNLVSFYKDNNRHPNMQSLYNTVNGGQFGTLKKMDLIKSFDDRQSLIYFINHTPTFVNAPIIDVPVMSLGVRCFG